MDDDGDGIKSFVSTFLTIKSLDRNIILLDEPESFLHPPVANRLGEIIAESLSDHQQIFVTTHSEDIINGIVSKVKKISNINVIRITRNGNINNFNILNKDGYLLLRKKGLIISSNILKGLFSKVVYITESYNDSVIYQKILSRFHNSSDFYFVNVQGKSNIHTISEFYSSLGVLNYQIYDYDLFGDADCINVQLKTTKLDKSVQKEFRDTLNEYRSKIRNKSKENNLNDKNDIKKAVNKLYHQYGINSLNNIKLNNKIVNIIDVLKENNIIVIKTGCLESVLEELGFDYSENKKELYDKAFEFIDNCDDDILKNSTIYKTINVFN